MDGCAVATDTLVRSAHACRQKGMGGQNRQGATQYAFRPAAIATHDSCRHACSQSYATPHRVPLCLSPHPHALARTRIAQVGGGEDIMSLIGNADAITAGLLRHMDRFGKMGMGRGKRKSGTTTTFEEVAESLL